MEDQFTVCAYTHTFEKGVDSNKCSEDLGFNHFYV
jgi:hypothetical protein